MSKLNTGAGASSLDRIRKAQSFDDSTDRQNLADTMRSSPERAASLLLTPPTESDRMGFVDQDAVTPLSRPASARASDPGQIGSSGWFQRPDPERDNAQQELLVPQPKPSAVTVALAVTAVAIVVGGLIWLAFF